MLFIWMWASRYIGCLVNTNGMDVISSNSVIVLGFIPPVRPPPLPPLAGVAPVDGAGSNGNGGAAGAGAGVIVVCSTLLEKVR